MSLSILNQSNLNLFSIENHQELNPSNLNSFPIENYQEEKNGPINSLPLELLSKIFATLSLQNLLIACQVCKTWDKQLCATQPKLRNGYILQHYDIVDISKNCALEDCNTFLIEENHDDEELRRANGLFISKFATPGSILSVEGEKGLLSHKSAKYQFDVLYINTPHIQKVFGWDLEIVTFGDKFTVREIALEVHDQESCVYHINWLKQMMKKINFSPIVDPEYYEEGEVEKVGEEIKKQIKDAAKSIREFEEIELQPLMEEMYEECTSKFIECLDKLVKRALEIDSQDFDFEMKKICKEHKCPWDEFVQSWVNRFCEAIENRRDFILTEIAHPFDFFPERTDSMVKALEKIDSMRSFDQLAFLIGGHAHLEEIAPEFPELSLKVFKNYIHKKGKIVILQRKHFSSLSDGIYEEKRIRATHWK